MTHLTKLIPKRTALKNVSLIERAQRIEALLENGEPYHAIGGKRLTLKPSLIRFRLGAYRLIFERQDTGYKALMLIPRKHLERELKRR
jgi:mRNA-degrading endonuclease RelE of RelBE toxin-antitoxin system